MGIHRFRASPRPDAAVVALLENALAAARRGDLRTVLVVTVNPVHELEYQIAGDTGDTRRTILLGGLSKVAKQLI